MTEVMRVKETYITTAMHIEFFDNYHDDDDDDDDDNDDDLS